MMHTLILTNSMGVFFLNFKIGIDRNSKIGRLPLGGAGYRNQEVS